MSRREPRTRLLHMRDFVRKALVFSEGQTRGDLETDEKLVDRGQRTEDRGRKTEDPS